MPYVVQYLGVNPPDTPSYSASPGVWKTKKGCHRSKKNAIKHAAKVRKRWGVARIRKVKSCR